MSDLLDQKAKVMSHRSYPNPQTILYYLAKTELLLSKIWRVPSAGNRERKTACFSTSPSYLSMMTTQTMPDPAHSPRTALNSLSKDRAFLMEFFLDILHPAHSLSNNSQIKQGGLSEANAFP